MHWRSWWQQPVMTTKAEYGKTMHKYLAPIAVLLAITPAAALDLSANGGINTQYIFRGVPQSDGKAAAFGGLDLQQSGFYAGTWASTVNSPPPVPVVSGPAVPAGSADGLEVDLYGGYDGALGEVSYRIGTTWYTYTDQFDDDYLELNLSATWKWLAVTAVIGEYDNFTGPRQNYQFYSMNIEYHGLYATIGIFTEDFSGNYYEAGYSSTLTAGNTTLFDYGLSLVYSDKALLGGSDDVNLVARISRTFDLFNGAH